MADSHTPAEPTSDLHVRGSYLPVREGHPRFNLVLLLVLILAFIVFALVEAQRLQF